MGGKIKTEDGEIFVLSGGKFLMAKLSIKITAGEETSASLSMDCAWGRDRKLCFK
jgi:hypothetical protein